MLSDISNIIIEDEFIIIVTTDGDKHTIAIDNDNPVHKGYIDNIISMGITLVNDTNPDTDMDMEMDAWGDYSDDDDDY